MKLEVKSRTELSDIPSASGIEFYGNSFYIVGDNSACLYQLNLSLEGFEKYRIFEHLNKLSDTIPKKEKPDFEATTIIAENDKAQLYIFGSGSKSPMRDILVKVDLKNPQNYQTLSLEKFYLHLRSGGISELNIEGAVYVNERIYLLNRADNSIVSFVYAEFEMFLQSSTNALTFTHHKFELPVVNNVQAAFSGASIIPGTHKMIFTASLEQTDNWIDDGVILGSYVGLVDLNKLSDTNIPEMIPVLEHSKTSSVKIESVTVQSAGKHKVHLFMVTDSDGGSSELIEANLFF